MSGHHGRSVDAAEIAHTARGGRRDVGGHEAAIDEILVKLVVGLAAGDVEPCARLYVVVSRLSEPRKIRISTVARLVRLTAV